jgi:hypothetical protein
VTLVHVTNDHAFGQRELHVTCFRLTSYVN